MGFLPSTAIIWKVCCSCIIPIMCVSHACWYGTNFLIEHRLLHLEEKNMQNFPTKERLESIFKLSCLNHEVSSSLDTWSRSAKTSSKLMTSISDFGSTFPFTWTMSLSSKQRTTCQAMGENCYNCQLVPFLDNKITLRFNMSSNASQESCPTKIWHNIMVQAQSSRLVWAPLHIQEGYFTLFLVFVYMESCYVR